MGDEAQNKAILAQAALQLKRLKAHMAEDDQKLWHDEIQELTDAAIRKIDAALNSKQEEIMQF